VLRLSRKPADLRAAVRSRIAPGLVGCCCHRDHRGRGRSPSAPHSTVDVIEVSNGVSRLTVKPPE
jgi:hypothetical protein